jgi:cell division protein FtsI/penicillin-binding protein 2
MSNSYMGQMVNGRRVDVYGRSISQQPYKVSEPVSGKNLYLTINGDVQNKVYEILENQ